MTLARVTCADLFPPDLDAEVLEEALQRRGVSTEVVVWDDPTVDWPSYDLVVLRTPWDYIDRVGEFVAWARRVDPVNLLLAAKNKPASGANDPKDLDRNGVINVLDSRKQVLLCTRLRCTVG